MPTMLILSMIIAQAVISNCYEVTITRTFCEETLASGLYFPTGLMVDNANELYFSNYSDNLTSFKLNLETKELVQLPGVVNGRDHAVINNGREVYVGGENGLYKYNPKKKRSIFVGAGDMNINKVFYKDLVYFTTVYASPKMYTFKNGKYRLFEDMKDTTASDFVIDNDDTMFFTNVSAFYKQQLGSKDAVRIQEGSVYPVLWLALNPYGEVFASKYDGIYFVNKESLALEKVVDIINSRSIAFDKDGSLIYAAKYKIYRLTPKTSPNSCE